MARTTNRDGSARTTSSALLLKPLEAARHLGISERTLWAQTQPRGPIPFVRIGHCVRYCPEMLRGFIAEQAAACFAAPAGEPSVTVSEATKQSRNGPADATAQIE